MSGRHVAAPLYDKLGPEGFAIVAEWLRDTVAENAIEVEDPTPRVIPPSLPWLVEAVTMYDPT